jgi:Mn-dependent DtxR family transcriptional regulator
LTLPVTTATAERSFSKLKLIKNYLKTSMGLSDLSILSIETEHFEKLKSCSAMDLLIKSLQKKSKCLFANEIVDWEGVGNRQLLCFFKA